MSGLLPGSPRLEQYGGSLARGSGHELGGLPAGGRQLLVSRRRLTGRRGRAGRARAAAVMSSAMRSTSACVSSPAALPPGSYLTPDTYGSSAEKLPPLGSAFVAGGPVRPSADGLTLTVGLGGSPCDTAWGGLVAEAGGAVAVGGWMRNPDQAQACAAMLVRRLAAVRLTAPLGDRVVLDAATGRPVTEEPSSAPGSGGVTAGPRVGSEQGRLFLLDRRET
jgi:hypothetical protein